MRTLLILNLKKFFKFNDKEMKNEVIKFSIIIFNLKN